MFIQLFSILITLPFSIKMFMNFRSKISLHHKALHCAPGLNIDCKSVQMEIIRGLVDHGLKLVD